MLHVPPSGALPKETLALDIKGCNVLSDMSGFRTLGRLKLLRECRLNLRDTDLGDLRVLCQGLGTLPGLSSLSLVCSGCGYLGDLAGAEALAGLDALRDFRLEFRSMGFSEILPLTTGMAGMRRLETLSLDFSNCRYLESVAGFEALSELRGVRECHLDFRGSRIRRAGPIGAGPGCLAGRVEPPGRHLLVTHSGRPMGCGHALVRVHKQKHVLVPLRLGGMGSLIWVKYPGELPVFSGMSPFESWIPT